MNKYKTFEELKEELGDKFEDYMYKANIELLNKLDKIKEIFKDYGDSENIVGYSMYNITGEDLLIIKELLEEVE